MIKSKFIIKSQNHKFMVKSEIHHKIIKFLFMILS